MGIEIERKYLVIGESWRESAGPGQQLLQGYLTRNGSTSVRVRLSTERAFLTVKGEREGIARLEFEYEVPFLEAEQMLHTLCVEPLVEKTRFRIKHGGLTWEIDVFSGRAEGLVLAEVELRAVDQRFDKPSWAGAEVTHDRRYRNAYLAKVGAPAALASPFPALDVDDSPHDRRSADRFLSPNEFSNDWRYDRSCLKIA